MPYEREGPRKTSRDLAELQEIRDRLLKVERDFSLLQEKMKAADMKEIMLALGTFNHHLGSSAAKAGPVKLHDGPTIARNPAMP